MIKKQDILVVDQPELTPAERLYIPQILDGMKTTIEHLARSITGSRPTGNFYAPRPIVEGEITRPEHPVFYGYTGKTLPLKYANGPLLQVPEADRDEQVLMKFTGGDKAVLSGLMRGADQIKDRPALVDVPVGAGRLLMFTTNPVYRWQNHGEFNMLFNPILHLRGLGIGRP